MRALRIPFLDLVVYRERAGVISDKVVWVAAQGAYLYIADDLVELVRTLLFEWKHDNHLAM